MQEESVLRLAGQPQSRRDRSRLKDYLLRSRICLFA